MGQKIKIEKVSDASFSQYGRIVKNVSFENLIKALQRIAVPSKVVYEPSVAELETALTDRDRNRLFGELLIQIGYCGGHNSKLNAVEYHRSSEIDVAATDAVLLVGSRMDITEDYTYDTSKMKAFLLPAGTAVELYATTLHYAPCNPGEDGFMVGIILPKDTNELLSDKHERTGEDRLLAAKNKWLIGHPEAELPEGSWIGLVGDNLEI